jgi:hypothetical protein
MRVDPSERIVAVGAGAEIQQVGDLILGFKQDRHGNNK